MNSEQTLEATNQFTGLQQALEQVLILQDQYSAQNTESMQMRGTIIRDVIPAALRRILFRPNSGNHGGLLVTGRDAIGNKSKVPWTRVYRSKYSPNPREGWYAVYLFALDGSAAFLSLNQGTLNWTEDGQLNPKPNRDILRNVVWAREILADQIGQNSDLVTTIQLRDPGDRSPGSGYERGNVCAIRYTRGSVPSSDILATDLTKIVSLLDQLYRYQDVEISPASYQIFMVDPDLEIPDVISSQGHRAGGEYLINYEEKLLVWKYRSYLKEQGVNSAYILFPNPIDRSLPPLKNDIWVPDRNQLIEAKEEPTRENVRMVIGQIADYYRTAPQNCLVGALFNNRPHDDLLNLLESQKITGIWQYGDGRFADNQGGLFTNG